MPARVLVVDDHPTNLSIMEMLLEDEYELRLASSGTEALAAVPEFRPAVVLLDVNLPDVDGYEVCRQLRESPENAHLKILFVSAKAMESERQRGFEAGGDDYIVKPFDHDEMLAKVQGCVEA